MRRCSRHQHSMNLLLLLPYYLISDWKYRAQLIDRSHQGGLVVSKHQFANSKAVVSRWIQRHDLTAFWAFAGTSLSCSIVSCSRGSSMSATHEIYSGGRYGTSLIRDAPAHVTVTSDTYTKPYPSVRPASHALKAAPLPTILNSSSRAILGHPTVL